LRDLVEMQSQQFFSSDGRGLYSVGLVLRNSKNQNIRYFNFYCVSFCSSLFYLKNITNTVFYLQLLHPYKSWTGIAGRRGLACMPLLDLQSVDLMHVLFSLQGYSWSGKVQEFNSKLYQRLFSLNKSVSLPHVKYNSPDILSHLLLF